MSIGKVVAVANMKGGVGKTTVSIALAEASAYIGRGHVLVVDLDPQINASYTLSGSTPKHQVPWQTTSTLVDWLEAQSAAKPADPNSYVCDSQQFMGPGGPRSVRYLSGSSALLQYERSELARPGSTVPATLAWFHECIDRLLAAVRPNFGLIVFDCPPGISLLCEAALQRADRIIIPTSPTALSTMGIEAYFKYLEKILEMGTAAKVSKKSAIIKTMVPPNPGIPAREWLNAIDALANRYYVFSNCFDDRVAWANAMDRSGGHSSFRAMYGTEAAQLEAITHEFWKIL